MQNQNPRKRESPYSPHSLPSAYRVYYGLADSAANYGGYEGNASKKPSTLTRCLTGGRKGRCPKKRSEKEYLTFLSGFRQLAPKDAVLNNRALSYVDLQDLIAGADSIFSREWKDDQGQVCYVYEMDGTGAHSLISVTCAKNKLYAHFVNAPTLEWNRDQVTPRHIHESFRSVGS